VWGDCLFRLLGFFFLVFFCTGCVFSKPRGNPSAFAGKIQDNIIFIEPQLVRFERPGPFQVMSRLDREFNLDLDDEVVVDHFFVNSSDKLPVVLMSHGNFSNKRAHRQQARHLASWGFHVVTVESPNRDQWLENGVRLKKIADMLRSFPKILGQNADSSRMIVVGHSFGGSAAVLASGSGAPFIGAILLDPAVVHPDVIDAMQRSDIPVALLGSDKRVFTARGRWKFGKNISGEMIEVTVPYSTHDDAQGPSVFSQAALGVDPFTSDKKQARFRSLLTVAVIGIASSGTLDFPLRVFSKAADSGLLADLKFKESLEN